MVDNLKSYVYRKTSRVSAITVAEISSLFATNSTLVTVKNRIIRSKKYFVAPCMKRSKRRIVPNVILVQQLDDNFFEKFGTQLKETGEASEAVKDEEQEERNKYQEEEDAECDAGEVLDSFVECEKPVYNVEDLYLETIYELLHLVGQDATCGIKKDLLFSYLRNVFSIEDAIHTSILNTAKAKPAPTVVLKVEVMEAKNLTAKDANGLSDPYCILWVSSNPTTRFNTEVKNQTLNPTWQENIFSLNISSATHDVLHIEVWDLDPAETIGEKMAKIKEVKGVWGVKKLLKEITSAAYNGQHDNELIGSAQISLKNIPSTGQMAWFNLSKKQKAQGMILLTMMFGSEKDPVVALAEHRHLINAILLEQTNNESFDAENWNGRFCDEAEIVLRQHLAQSNLGCAEDLMAKWAEYINIHQSKRLNFAVLAKILQDMIPRLKNGLFTEDEKKLFWDSARKLLPSCFNFIRRINKAVRKDIVDKMTAIVSIIKDLSMLNPHPSIDLFPADVYGWLTIENLTIKNVLHEAVVNGACDWFDYLLRRHKGEEDTFISKLQDKVKIADFINIDMGEALAHNEQIFNKILQYPYCRTLFAVYQCRVCEMAEPTVIDMCSRIRPLDFENRNDQDNNDPLSMGTTLFEFYLKLQKLHKIGKELLKEEYEKKDFEISKYNSWFHYGVVNFLDIAAYKAMQRIERAVDLDDFIPVDGSVQYSGSAVDAVAIYHQVKTFWDQLEWPDVEGCYTFVARIIDDICKCSVHYADKIGAKVDHMGEIVTAYETKFEVTDEWCIAINNIDFVYRNINPLVTQLGLEKILNSLADFKSEAAAEHCRQTLESVMNNTIETVDCKILDLLDTVAKKMEPSMIRFLQEGAELLHQQSNILDRLMTYLDTNLMKLNSRLNTDNFNRILDIIWDKLSTSLYNLVQSGIEKRRPPSFFSNLRETLSILIGFFKQDNEEEAHKRNEMLSKIEKTLELYGMETADLIHHYYFTERYQQQQAIEKSTDGIMAVMVNLTDDTMHLDVLNAQNIRVMDSNGYSDPYVSIRFLPKHKFAGIKHKTKVQKKTLFPLFDEKFSTHLTPEQRQMKNAMLMFTMKDQDLYGAKNEYMAEAFLPFSVAEESNGKQIHLKLNRPIKRDSEILKALEYRQGDKLARDFAKQQKVKMGNSNQ